MKLFSRPEHSSMGVGGLAGNVRATQRIVLYLMNSATYSFINKTRSIYEIQYQPWGLAEVSRYWLLISFYGLQLIELSALYWYLVSYVHGDDAERNNEISIHPSVLYKKIKKSEQRLMYSALFKDKVAELSGKEICYQCPDRYMKQYSTYPCLSNGTCAWVARTSIIERDSQVYVDYYRCATTTYRSWPGEDVGHGISHGLRTRYGFFGGLLIDLTLDCRWYPGQ